MPKLRPVDLDFVGTAPSRWSFEAVVPAPRARVFKEVAGDAEGWAEWFPGFSSGAYDGTRGVGAKRIVRYMGTTIFETIVAWDEPTRWAFRVDRWVVPMAKALVEDWTFEDRPEGTLVRWTYAAEPTLPIRLIAPVQRRTMSRTFRRAMRNLGERLAR